MKCTYDSFNREERAICSHLFRLLHENLIAGWKSPLGKFITRLSRNLPENKTLQNIVGSENFENAGIFTEVAIIRDYYDKLKPNVNAFMDRLVEMIGIQEKVLDYRIYSNLDSSLNTPDKTHPKQIYQKAKQIANYFSRDECRVYGALQGMFNAKPDLVITLNNELLVFEAKFTLGFDNEQIIRTQNIADVWGKLLNKEFGFESPINPIFFKLGHQKFFPDISWQEIFEIVKETYPPDDRTFISMESACNLLN